jgi:hypothetical protein
MPVPNRGYIVSKSCHSMLSQNFLVEMVYEELQPMGESSPGAPSRCHHLVATSAAQEVGGAPYHIFTLHTVNSVSNRRVHVRRARGHRLASLRPAARHLH